MKVFFISVLTFFCVSSIAFSETMKGVVLNVHDGDTIKVEIECDKCPDMFKVWGIRVLGIGTPELHSKSEKLKQLAIRAREMTSNLCPVGSPILLLDVSFDKYGQRLDANPQCIGGAVKDVLLSSGLAKVYTGVGPKPWIDSEDWE